MNLQIHHVINDITEVTGSAIIEKILAGERDAAELAKLRQPEIRASEEIVRKSLQDDWRREHLFTLQPCWNLYKTYLKAIEACDEEICALLAEHEVQADPEIKPLPPDSKKRQKRNQKRTGDFRFEVGAEAYKRFGVDVTQIPGMGGMALTLYSELGSNRSKWPSAGEFASWTGLGPDNDKSGGQVLWTAVRRIKNRAGQLFRQAANSWRHTHHAPYPPRHGCLLTVYESQFGSGSRDYRHGP